VVEAIIRAQMCTGCKICEKSCRKGAISIRDTIVVDEKKCNRCGKCFQGCIAAAEASKIFPTLQKKQKIAH
jgi:heterodisulfide reductase subunit A-like polyferredoxin